MSNDIQPEEDFTGNYDNIEYDYTESNLHINDRAYIKRMFEKMQLNFSKIVSDEVERREKNMISRVSDEVCKYMAVIVQDNNKLLVNIKEDVSEMRKEIGELKENSNELEARILLVEQAVELHNKVLEGHQTILRGVSSIKRWYKVALWVALGLSGISTLMWVGHLILKFR